MNERYANMPYRIAIVHEHLHIRGGSEKVVEAMLGCFPEADLFALTYDPAYYKDTVIAGRTVRTTWLQRLPMGHRSRLWLPIMPCAVKGLDLRGYDLVISSNHLVAKGYRKAPGQLHLCYIHTPMRAAWDLYDFYLQNPGRAGWLYRTLAPLLIRRLRAWDRRAADGVDYFIANSTAVAERVRRYYQRQAMVIHPPVQTARFRPVQTAPSGLAQTALFGPEAAREAFYLCVARLVPSKRLELAVLACTQAQVPLVIIGDGPERSRLRALGGPTLELPGALPDADVATYMRRCRAFLVPGVEDFGIATVEAQAAGAPVIAFNRGGSRDIVEDGVTGLFFSPQTAEALAEKITELERTQHLFDAETISRTAQRFDAAVFAETLKSEVNRRMAQHQEAIARERQ